MSRLTTAIDKGERKVPEGHKCAHYEMAPGRALRVDEEGKSEAVDVDAKTCKASPYQYRLKWVSGVTMAIFGEKPEYMQPIRNMPVPKGVKREAKIKLDNGSTIAVAKPAPAERIRGTEPKPKKELDLGW